jgi:hypothetical protein
MTSALAVGATALHVEQDEAGLSPFQAEELLLLRSQAEILHF